MSDPFKTEMNPGDLTDCPRCGYEKAVNITPLKKHTREVAVFNCSKCGYAFTASGGEYIKSAQELADTFSGVRKGAQTISEVLFGERLNTPTKALALAKLVDYGYEMWRAGFYQGLVATATEEEYQNGKDGNEQRGTAGEPQKRGGGADDEAISSHVRLSRENSPGENANRE